MSSFLKKLKELFDHGLFHIMGSTVINKMVAFITNVALVRILSKSDYGIFSSAFNVFLIVSLFSGFGIPSAMLFFGSDKETEGDRRGVYLYALKYGFCISLILCATILGYGLFGNVGIEESRPYVLSLSALPLIGFLFEYYSVILRSRKENRKYALLMNVNSISYCVFAVAGSSLAGIKGTIAGRYLAYFVTAVVGFFFSRCFVSYGNNINLERKKRKEIVSYSVHTGIMSAMNNILYRIDITLISILVADATLLASYKTAAVIPESMIFIPSSILIVYLPLFIENQDNKQWIISKSKDLFKAMSVVCLVLTIGMIVFAGLIVRILWGEQYMDGIPYFRILAVSFFFLGVFRSTSTNILQAIGKVRFNLYVSIVASLSNIVLDIIMVKQWGVLGAALATLFVTIIASAMSFPYLIMTLRRYSKS